MNYKIFDELKLKDQSISDYQELDNWNNRRFIINDNIDDDIIDDVVVNILKINQEDQLIPIKERNPIKIYINTNGGNVINMFSLVDMIKISKTPIYTINLGKCYSSGFFIFIAGDKRYALPTSTFLLHESSCSISEVSSKFLEEVDFYKNLENVMKKFVLNQTTIPKNLYEKNYKKEWYMFPCEAKRYGIVTDIIGIDCDIDDLYEID